MQIDPTSIDDFRHPGRYPLSNHIGCCALDTSGRTTLLLAPPEALVEPAPECEAAARTGGATTSHNNNPESSDSAVFVLLQRTLRPH